MEVICIDDGSTDKSSEVVKSFPIKYLYIRHSGISNARNVGFSICTGKYVVFLDAHLVLKKRNTLKIFRQYFEKYPQVAAICGEYKAVQSNDWNFVRDLRRIALFHKNNNNRFITISNFTTLSLAICAFRRSILTKYKFPKEFFNSYGEDTFLQIQMHNDHHIFLYTPQIIGLHDASIAPNKVLNKMLFEIRACCNILLNIEDSIKVPYLHYFLSYPLLLFISTALLEINRSFFLLLLLVIFKEFFSSLRIFYVPNYSLKRRFIAFLYVICKELIQGIYLPFYVLSRVHSIKQVNKILKIIILWEFEKYLVVK